MATLPIALLNTLLFLSVSFGLVVAFTLLYVRITPYDELELIRKDNQAAAFALSGAVIGFVIMLGAIVRQSHMITEMLLWAAIGTALQLVLWWVLHFWIGGLEKRMAQGDTASGITLGGFSIAIGIVNASCLTA